MDASGRKSEATYYYDLEIKLADQNPDCFNYFWVNLGLVLITAGLVYGWSQIDAYAGGTYDRKKEESKNIMIGFICAFYIGMIIESFCSRTFSFFNNIESADRG
jgi:hypothetical protein